MVHALEEIHRVLAPTGTLLDLRPLADRWPVEIEEAGHILEIGRLTDLPLGLSDDQAANLSVKTAAKEGLYRRGNELHFPLYIYWDDPDEMIGYVAEKWADFVIIDEHIQNYIHAAWEVSGTGKHIRIKLKMLLTRWNKQV
jgi:hypothetical protein